jgi:hypothetical protein
MDNNPYAPSASTLAGAPEASKETEDAGFRDLSGITRAVSILLLIGLGLAIVQILSARMQLNMLSNAPYTAADARANLVRQSVVAGARVLMYLGTVIVFGRWIYLAHRNLPNLGARSLRFTPGWAVGCFFVPFLNLWAPYQAMRDLAKASRAPLQWDLEETPHVIVIWWVLWLIVQIFGSGVSQVGLRAHTVAGLETVTTLQMASALASTPVYLLAFYIVRRVWRDQAKNHAEPAIITGFANG